MIPRLALALALESDLYQIFVLVQVMNCVALCASWILAGHTDMFGKPYNYGVYELQVIFLKGERASNTEVIRFMRIAVI